VLEGYLYMSATDYTFPPREVGKREVWEGDVIGGEAGWKVIGAFAHITAWDASAIAPITPLPGLAADALSREASREPPAEITGDLLGVRRPPRPTGW
jgi:hypothetical protein